MRGRRRNTTRDSYRAPHRRRCLHRALATSVLRATRSPTNGPSRPPTNRTHTEWSGSTSRTHTASSGRDVSHSRGPSLTSSATSQNEKVRRPGTESAESSPKQVTASTDRAKAETGPHRGRRQQTPRLPFYQLKTGHCLTGQYLHGRPGARTRCAGGANTADRPENTCSRTALSGDASRKPSGQPS